MAPDRNVLRQGRQGDMASERLPSQALTSQPLVAVVRVPTHHIRVSLLFPRESAAHSLLARPSYVGVRGVLITALARGTSVADETTLAPRVGSTAQLANAAAADAFRTRRPMGAAHLGARIAVLASLRRPPLRLAPRSLLQGSPLCEAAGGVCGDAMIAQNGRSTGAGRGFACIWGPRARPSESVGQRFSCIRGPHAGA